MGFALPIETITGVLDKLEKNEKIERPVFGVQLIDLDSTYLRRYDLEVDSELTYGSVIIKVEDSTPADKAELKVGDVIVKINNDKITDTAHFRYSLYKYSVGDTIKVTYNRNGEEKTVNVKLSDRL